MLSAKREGVNHPYTDHKEHECRNSFLYDAKSTNLGGRLQDIPNFKT
jgi:hypothetical protein